MCDICQHWPCVPRCPNYKMPKTGIRCMFCGEEIQYGEPFLEFTMGQSCIRCAEDKKIFLNKDDEIDYEVKSLYLEDKYD